jgi:hypothetical protein
MRVLLEKPSHSLFDHFCSAHETILAYKVVYLIYEVFGQLYSHILADHALSTSTDSFGWLKYLKVM